MTNAIVFCGPTLTEEAARTLFPEADVRGPAAQGDIYRAARANPWGIGIVDGLFEHRPSVWHKEILWALTGRIRVYGAASMGALRAAELGPYGMIGVGHVYEAFASGALEDDDEVTIVHDWVDGRHQPRSEALVNIRATLAAALAEDAIDRRSAEQIVDQAKAIFYPDRTLGGALAAWIANCSPDATCVNTIRAWLGPSLRARVDVKRRDAEALLARMRQDWREGTPGPEPTFDFAATEAWFELRRHLDAELGGP